MTRLFCGCGVCGLRIGRWYASIKSPGARAYFSERNRIRTRVVALPFGWRVVLRWDA